MRSSSDHARARVIARAVATLAFAVLPLAASAEDHVDSSRSAMALVYEGRCDEALPEIEALRRRDDSAELARVDGQCRLRVRDYSGALAALDDAERMDPGMEDVAVYRGVALYQLEDYAAAKQAFADSRGRTSATAAPQKELYSGLLLLQERKNREAAQALDRARVLDPAQVEPVASFYAGLAWQAVGERDLARESLMRVKAADPDGAWGQRAEELLSGQGFDERSWASIRVGIEGDSNVVLLGQSVPTPLGISNEADGRVAWFLEGGAELFNKGRFSGGLAATYSGNVQFHLNQFDIQYPRATGWLDYEVDPENLLRLRYGFGYAWVDYSPFLLTQDATLTWYRNWGMRGNTELGLSWIWNDYKFFILPVPNGAQGQQPGQTCNNGDPFVQPCAPFGLAPVPVNFTAARNRDGNGLRPSLIHRYRVRSINYENFRDIELRGGYAYQRYWAEGTDWDFQAHDFMVGAKVLLFWGIQLDSQLNFIYQPYTNTSSFPAPPTFNGLVYPLSPVPRTDKITNIIGVFEKAISDHWSVLARYSYTRDNSNIVVFDYSRHIGGAYAKYTF